jgi:hypothetical protein
MALPKTKYATAQSAAPGKSTGKVSAAQADVATRKPLPHEKPTARADEFPLLSIMQKSDMNRARQLLEEEVELKEAEDLAATQRKAGRAELLLLADKYKQDGFRHGTVAMYVYRGKTRRTLDARLLLENGVTTEQLDASYTESKPWDEVQVKQLQRPD